MVCGIFRSWCGVVWCGVVWCGGRTTRSSLGTITLAGLARSTKPNTVIQSILPYNTSAIGIFPLPGDPLSFPQMCLPWIQNPIRFVPMRKVAEAGTGDSISLQLHLHLDPENLCPSRCVEGI